MNITTLIITKNAERTLEKTLQSAIKLGGTIVVIDDYSPDNTKCIARNYGCDVIVHHAENYGAQRAFALAQVTTEWTLVLDSDEVLTSENRAEIGEVVGNHQYDGYYLKFRNHLFGKKLIHGELHKKLVLFKTEKASITPKSVHEQYEVKGKLGELEYEVLHYSYQSVGQIIWKFFNYAILQAIEYKKENIKYGIRELILHPVHMFYARYIKDEGYKDGGARIFLDYQFAHMEFLSYFLIPFVKTKKRISVDCGPYSVGGVVQSGIDRLIQGIFSHASKENDYYWFHFGSSSINKLPRRFYAQIWLPLKTIFSGCDVFLGVAGHIPTLLEYLPIYKILFLYDFGFFSSPDKYDISAKRLQRQTEDSIQRANKIIVLHEEIYREFMERYPKQCYKVAMIPAGADHLNSLKEQPVFIQPKKPAILYVGVVKPVKRIDTILSVVGDYYCIIAGPQEEKYVKKLKIGAAQHIQFIKNFNDGQLKWLYTYADVMIYTSEHEGFCYPVLEALTLGLPVIVLNLPLFHEYKKYFPHLTIVKTADEMKKKLKNIDYKKYAVSNNTPYTWSSFNTQLSALWQPDRLTRHENKKIGFIIILYKTPNEERDRLENEIGEMRLEHYALYFIDNSNNSKGYAAGINEGIRKGLLEDCTDFVALNPDISLTSITAETVLKVSGEFDVWGLGMRQNNTIYYGGEIDTWRMSGGLAQNSPRVRYASVDFVSGSLMGFSKRVVQTIGLWDESYFMYYEDVDYCERARRAGFEVGVDSYIVYEHFEISKENKEKKNWIALSRWSYFWKYANIKQKIREIFRLPKTILGQ